MNDRTRAKRIASQTADCLAKDDSGATIDKVGLRRIIVSTPFVEWLRSGSEQLAAPLDEQFDNLVHNDTALGDHLRRRIAICVIEAFEAVVAEKNPGVAIILGIIRKATDQLQTEMRNNTQALEARLEAVSGAAESASTSVNEALWKVGRRIDALQDDIGLLIGLIERRGASLGFVDSAIRVGYQAELEQYDQFYRDVQNREEDILEILTRLYDPNTSIVVVEGAPWSGKTAFSVKLRQVLLAAGWRAVTYYWRELDSDADNFLDVVNTQLLDLLKERGGVPLRFEEKRAQFTALWERAVAHPQPLILLIDGVDEQPADQPLARLVPRTFGLSGRVVLSTRPQPDFTARVHPTHPLASGAHASIFQLRESPYSVVAKADAERATARLLETKPTIAGLIAVADDLSIEDLVDILVLEGFTPGQVVSFVGPSTRHIRRSTDSGGTERLSWAHVELKRAVDSYFGTGRRDLVTLVTTWCDRYQAHDWPADTPEWCLRHLDSFVRRERIDPFRWLKPTRRERMMEKLLHVEPFVHGIHRGDEYLRQGDNLGKRLDLAGEYFDTLERGRQVPNSIFLGLELVGRADAAREAASAHPSMFLPAWEDRPPDVSWPGNDADLVAELMVEDVKRGLDPGDSLRIPGGLGPLDLVDRAIATAWYLAKTPYEGLNDPDRTSTTKRVVEEAVAIILKMPREGGLGVLRDIAGRLAVSYRDVAMSIALRHPQRNGIALHIADQQDPDVLRVQLPTAVPTWPERPVPPQSAQAAFAAIRPLVDDDASLLADLCYNVIRWAPAQGTELALRVLELDPDLARNHNPYGLVQALAQVDPGSARRVVEASPHLVDRHDDTNRLLALGVVHDRDRFEAALENATNRAERPPHELKDWLLSDAIDRVALQDKTRALDMFVRIAGSKDMGFAVARLAKKLKPEDPAWIDIADRVEATIDRASFDRDVAIRFGLAAITLVDPHRALRALERWESADDINAWPGYEAIGRIAISDADAARHILKGLRYPWWGCEAAARHLAESDQLTALEFCAEIPFASLRAKARSRVASAASSEDEARLGFGAALDAFMATTETDSLSEIVLGVASSGLAGYRQVGLRTIDRLCHQWAEA